MKWVKVAIGAVIAIAVVPMIAISVFNLTQETTKEEVVTFEVLTATTVTSGTYNDISNYAVILPDLTITNVQSITLNGINSDSNILGYNGTEFLISSTFNTNFVDLELYNDDTITDIESALQVGDTFEITFEVTTPPVLSGVTATLLLLAPVIFVSGVLYFIYNNKQEGI